VVAPFLPRGPQPDLPIGGTTLRNDPSSLPDPKAVARKQAKETETRINQELKEQIAEARVRNGLVSPAFIKTQNQLNDVLNVNAPRLDPAALGEVFGAFGQLNEQYGKTGSPVTSPDDTRSVENTGMGRTRTMQMGPRLPYGNLYDNALQQFAIIDMVEKNTHRVRLKTRVEVLHDAAGVCRSTRIVQPSGRRVFEDHVLQTFEHNIDGAKLVSGERLPPGEWLVSVWEVTYEPPKIKTKLLSVRTQQGPVP
jgi:hypothetical protein